MAILSEFTSSFAMYSASSRENVFLDNYKKQILQLDTRRFTKLMKEKIFNHKLIIFVHKIFFLFIIVLRSVGLMSNFLNNFSNILEKFKCRLFCIIAIFYFLHVVITHGNIIFSSFL